MAHQLSLALAACSLGRGFARLGGGKSVPELFGQGLVDPTQAPGLLAHMVPLDFQEHLNSADKKSVNLDDLIHADLSGDCGPTCSAWSWLRADFEPIMYVSDMWSWSNGDAKSTNRLSLLSDMSLRSNNIVSGMGVSDSDTWHRSACEYTNRNGAGAPFKFGAGGDNPIPACYESKTGCTCSTLELPAIDYDKPSNYADCADSVAWPDYDVCASLNSGGAMHLEDFENWQQCKDGNRSWAQCIETQGCAGGSCTISFSTDPNKCTACSRPYFCDPLSPKGAVGFTSKAVTIGVGPFGTSTFVDQFWFDSNPKQIESKMCKWSREDWSYWFEAMKLTRAAMKSAYDVKPWPVGPDESFPFLENEVNLYVPPATSKVYNGLNTIFQTSIQAIGVDLEYCEQRFADSNDPAKECADYFGKSCRLSDGCQDECLAIQQAFTNGCKLSKALGKSLYKTRWFTTLRPTKQWGAAPYNDIFEDLTEWCETSTTRTAYLDKNYKCK